MWLAVAQPLALDTYTEPGDLPGNSAHVAPPVSSAFPSQPHVVTEPALTGHWGHWLLLPCRENAILERLSTDSGTSLQEVFSFHLS